MCKLKSALVLKDRIFMPNHDSHLTMLEDLSLSDTFISPIFVRVEISPSSGNAFDPVIGWDYKVDQDYLPDWYVPEYDEKRVRESLASWAKDRFGKYITKREIGSLAVGERFQIGNIVYVVVEQLPEGTACVTEGVVHEQKWFDGESGNFATSAMHRYLNDEYLAWLAGEVGAENIVEHTVDLESYCGDGGCGPCKAKASLLTKAQYEKYRQILPKIEGWYWLATPYAKDSPLVCCVHARGFVGGAGCRWDCNSVRPFCIFKSQIFVSCE